MHSLSLKYFWCFFVAIILIGLLLRFYSLRSVPCGLFADQAINGLEVAKGKFLPYYTGYGEHDEGMFIWTLGAISKFTGLGQWQIFAVGGIFGSLTIPLIMLALRSSFGDFTSLVTGILLATSTWHIALARNGLRAITVPFMISLVYLCLTRLLRSGPKLKIIWSCLLGASLGLGLYTYSPFRIFAAFAIPVILISLALNHASKKIKFASLATFLLSFSLVLIPLLVFFYQHPEEATGRINQVSTFSQFPRDQAIAQIVTDTKKTLAGFFVGMDANFRNNLNNQPYLPLYINVFFLVGVLYLVATSIRHPKHFLLPLLFLLMLAPAVLTHEGSIPHGMRLIGEIPLVFIITAIGLVQSISLTSLVVNKLTHNKFSVSTALTTTTLIFLIGSLSATGIDQINKSLSSPQLASDFRCDLEEISSYIKPIPQTISTDIMQMPPLKSGTIWVISPLFDRFSLDFYLLGSGVKVNHLDPDNLARADIQSNDLIFAPVYGDLGFYHLDGDNILPYGGKQFIHEISLRYPSLHVFNRQISKYPTRYPQGISFLILSI